MCCRTVPLLLIFISCYLIGSKCIEKNDPPSKLIQIREIPTEQVPQTMDLEQNETLIFDNFTLDELSPADESNYNDLGIYPIPVCDRCKVPISETPDANETSDLGIATSAHFLSPPNSDKMPLFQIKLPVKPLSNESLEMDQRSFFPMPNARIPQALPVDRPAGKKPAITGNGGGGNNHRVKKRRKKTTSATTLKRLRKRKTTTSTTTSTTSKKKVKRSTIASKLVI